mmetsp:Transcript_46848/g.60215  ORF Transcript_46848/g.60215 Transcript_46848/m.60215 type:complete len:159 (+) Transcript_46848:436-912(+)
MRMASGKEGRTIADKISDTNRPTWDDYKKKNEDALDMEGSQLKKMAEYRKALDEERETMLKRLEEKKGGDSKRKGDAAISDSDDESDGSDESDDSDRHSKKKDRKKHKKKHKKHKKHKKEKKSKKEKKDSKKDGPGEENDRGFRYSDFFNNNSDDDSN